MYAYELNIQLEGLGVANIPKPMNDVYYQNIDGRLHVSTRLESESKDEISREKLQSGTRLLHESVLRLSFIHGTKISLAENGYTVKRLFDHKYQWHILSILNSGYSIGMNHDKLAEDISLLSAEMNSILNKTIGYYQAAMESTNLYIKNLLLVSCAWALIQEIYQIDRDLKIEHLKMGLDKVRKKMNIDENDFHDLICNIYRGRCRPAHGNIDITSNT
jgi:hypothetical protein